MPAIVWTHGASCLSRSFKDELPELGHQHHQLVDQLAVGFALCDGDYTVQERHFLESAALRDFLFGIGSITTTPERFTKAARAVEASTHASHILRSRVQQMPT